jgi:signal transduction histidine kinase
MKRVPVWLLLSLPVFVIAICLFVTWSLVIETERSIHANQLKQLQRTADSMAAVLSQDEHLVRRDDASQIQYVSQILEQQPVLDGRDDDWPDRASETLGLSDLLEINVAYTEESLSYQFRAGRDENFLYLHYRVVDDFVVYRQVNHPSVHRNDHIQIAFVEPQGLFRRYTLSTFQPGHIEAMEIGRSGRALRADPEITGRWLGTEAGYNLEIQIPLERLSERFSTLVADVDDQSKRNVRYLVGKSHTEGADLLGYLIGSISPLEKLVRELPWYTQVVDAKGNIIAESNTSKFNDASSGFLTARSELVHNDVKLGELVLGESSLPWQAVLDATKHWLVIVFGVTMVLLVFFVVAIRQGLRGRMLDAEKEVARIGQYNEYLERMASRLNHELQTPVSVIRSSIEHLQLEGGEYSVYLDRANEGIRRLANILNKMAEARRLEEALDEDEIIRFDLVEVVGGCVAGYQLAYPQQTFDLSIEVEALPVTGIPELIAQAFDKIVDNAVEFSERGAIRVRLNIEEGRAVLRVLNEGVRLPDGANENLFESMVSVREASGATHLGLGLYVARTITEYHGGQLSLSNREDVDGVVTTLRLPILRLTAKLS